MRSSSPATTTFMKPAISSGVHTVTLTSSPDRPCTLRLSPNEETDAFVGEKPLQLFGNHVLFAAPDLCHVGCDLTGLCAELSGVSREIGDARTPDLVLAGQAGDSRTGATNPNPLDNRDALPRTG
jgi:hypothetical protein